MPNKILDTLNEYFTKKITEHGPTPNGVGWNSIESQKIRFEQLCKIISAKEHFSLFDIGCGYGALLDYIGQEHLDFDYTGFDISAEMIDQARKTHTANKNASWTTQLPAGNMYDYVVTSGIFNLRLEINDADWTDHIIDTITTMNKMSTKGFSFNLLTSYSDKEYMRADLFYADPAFFFDYCKKNFSKYVAVLHDYQLYDFTILVRK